ncbi:ribosome small subunit-dependent GTPase A [Marinilabiliaceae bacterium JC040]|nr:ribosome small subunit-dependent GTPase A [Marinilabiliaceae bacterium JC040]
MEKGLVIKSTGSWYSVRMDTGQTYECRIQGKFRIKGIKSTNPVAVGDRVGVKIGKDDAHVIVAIEERKNYLVRKSINLSKQTHILASNIDRALLIATINYPQTTTVFIDRFLVSARAYGIPVTIVFNKFDAYTDKDKEQLAYLLDIYESIGYNCIITSAKESKNIKKVSDILKDQVTVLIGHSGVGKSTLINKIDPSLDLKTGAISDIHKQGKHTTTFAEMFDLEGGGSIIDTPGIRGYGLINMEKEELYHFFPEIFKESHNCKFHNCTHVHEPKCAVKKAVEEGRISSSRYESYLSMMNEDENEKYR